MSTKATAARIYEYGEPDVFRFETMDVPDPVGHEVLVRNTVKDFGGLDPPNVACAGKYVSIQHGNCVASA
jgi:NADPH-dependent curcumin reductase CurA